MAGFARPIKLSSNENGLGASPLAQCAFAEEAARLDRYPDASAGMLREALAAKHGLDPSRIVFGTGSDELFSLACQAYLAPGDAMVQPQFAFAAWAIAARATGADVISVREQSYTVDVDAMLAAVDARTRIVFIANPASPSGSCLPLTEIARLHAGLPKHILLVLDGAYAEFASDRSDYEDGLALAANAPNVLATRTFSKLYGLASLRLGWGYSSAPIAATLNRIRLPFNASGPAQAAALAALGDADFVARSLAHVASERDALEAFLAGLGLAPIAPTANFVTVRFPADFPLDAGAVDAALAAKGILVRNLASYAMPDCLRISIGTGDEMAALRAALLRICGEAGDGRA